MDSCKAVYERMLDLRIATPQIVINYAMFLEDNKYFEDAFKVCMPMSAATHRGFRRMRRESACSAGRLSTTSGTST